ncbi:MAG TPA: transcription termination/antitermination NusG family protein [Pyrinomonadaceae bacterium]|nr:transcription termination/antitermination NusG family protein [Pyrinomonadaceae bacterium]
MSVNETRADLRWYAVQTKAQQEERAESNLRAWNVETFAPRVRERRRGYYTGQAGYLIKSLFPRYIFARFDMHTLLHKVNFTRGVQSVVCFGGVPVPVEDEVLAIMQARLDADGFITIGEELKVGDRVMIQAGVFKNFIGIFEREVGERDRIRILLDTINYRSQITLDRAQVKKVGATYLSA